jgi:anti-sigma B factor antagonist
MPETLAVGPAAYGSIASYVRAGTTLDESERGERVVGERYEDSGLHEEPVKEVLSQDGAVVVRLSGELDLYNAATVRDALVAAAEAANRLVVDLSAVRFIDSTALGVLIEARSRLQNRSEFFLASPGLETRRALEISGLDRHFNVRETVDSALAAET